MNPTADPTADPTANPTTSTPTTSEPTTSEPTAHDPCHVGPCLNGATCINMFALTGSGDGSGDDTVDFGCVCPEGYTGDTCGQTDAPTANPTASPADNPTATTTTTTTAGDLDLATDDSTGNASEAGWELYALIPLLLLLLACLASGFVVVQRKRRLLKREAGEHAEFSAGSNMSPISRRQDSDEASPAPSGWSDDSGIAVTSQPRQSMDMVSAELYALVKDNVDPAYCEMGPAIDRDRDRDGVYDQSRDHRGGALANENYAWIKPGMQVEGGQVRLKSVRRKNPLFGSSASTGLADDDDLYCTLPVSADGTLTDKADRAHNHFHVRCETDDLYADLGSAQQTGGVLAAGVSRQPGWADPNCHGADAARWAGEDEATYFDIAPIPSSPSPLGVILEAVDMYMAGGNGDDSDDSDDYVEVTGNRRGSSMTSSAGGSTPPSYAAPPAYVRPPTASPKLPFTTPVNWQAPPPVHTEQAMTVPHSDDDSDNDEGLINILSVAAVTKP